MSQAGATARFDQLKAAFAACIKADFALAENDYAADSLKVLRKYSATVESDDPSASSVKASLELMEFDDGDYWVELDFQR